MKALVISHTHHLLPFAWRLKQEGWDVDVIIDRDSYEKAWAGRFSPLLASSKGSKGAKRSPRTKLAVRDSVEDGKVTVLCDSPKWLEVFEGYQPLFGRVERPEGAVRLPPWLLGAWFDGEEMGARHFLVEDHGLWPGGLGPDTLGGLTLISPREWPETFEVALSRVKDELKARGYRGLVKVGLQIDPKEPGEPVLMGYQAGWNFLQSHALLAESGDGGTSSFGEILQGEVPEFLHRYTLVGPVSIPPYPHRARTSQSASAVGIPPMAVKSGKFYWHDMAISDGVVGTAGLDGLVGVVKASANSFQLVCNKAVAFVRLLDLPELQVRADIGRQVGMVEALLEERGLAV